MYGDVYVIAISTLGPSTATSYSLLLHWHVELSIMYQTVIYRSGLRV